MPFISKTLRYSFCTCIRNILKIVTFVIEKMKLAYFSLFLDASPPPPRPKMPFGQLIVTIQIHNICKGRLGSRGRGGRGCISERRYQISAKIDHFARWSFLLYINCINSFTIKSVIGRLFTLV